MKVLIAVGLLSLVIVFSGCGDSAAEITGTLPVVTGITVDTLASKGDTIVITWTAMDTTLIDGYFLWTRSNLDGVWSLVEVCKNNAGTHIAKQSAFYSVMAFKNSDTSSGLELSANTRTKRIAEIRRLFDGKPVGFIVDVAGDSVIAGDPGLPEFNQQFVVAITPDGSRYVYPGTYSPERWPGGARTRISSRWGYVAPAAADSFNWKDSISYGDGFFLALENGQYCLLKATHTLPDTASRTDTLVINGQIQPIAGIRVFNEQL
jgi:hypothetical protein